jgi:hypothetical protein
MLERAFANVVKIIGRDKLDAYGKPKPDYAAK